MTLRSKRVQAAVLGLSAGFVGGWASIGPRSFYDRFPGSGHAWVSALGPYDEHLVRDVGTLYLALLVVSGWAVLRPQGELLQLCGAAWLVFSVPHLVFHLGHLQMYGSADVAGNVVSLGGTAVLAALLLAPGRRPDLTPGHDRDGGERQ